MISPFSTKQTRRQQLAAAPLPDAWLRYLRENVHLYARLSEEERAKLHARVQIFVAEKNWEGCNGLQVTDEMKVTIAAWASILLLASDDFYFDHVRTILIYPGSYIAYAPYATRGQHPSDQASNVISGEAHRKGPVILSWWDVRWTGQHVWQTNVVLHEFAHKLSELGEPINGVPPIEDDAFRASWTEVVQAEYERLSEDAAYDRPTVLRRYGASNLAEFFAVATESFFLDAANLRRRHRSLYKHFARFFAQDPARWPASAETASASAERAEKEYWQYQVAEYSAAIRRFPDDPRYYCYRAVSQRWLGAFDEAIADYGSAIDLSTGNVRAEIICARGRTYVESGRYERAVADYDEALRLCRRYARAYCERGIAQALAGHVEQALADLSRAIGLGGRDDKAFHHRAELYCDRGNYDRALRDVTRAIRIDPHRPSYYCSRARARLGRDEDQKAIADCDRALKLDPELAKAYRLRAVAYDNMGDRTHASADAAMAAQLEAAQKSSDPPGQITKES